MLSKPLHTPLSKKGLLIAMMSVSGLMTACSSSNNIKESPVEPVPHKNQDLTEDQDVAEDQDITENQDVIKDQTPEADNNPKVDPQPNIYPSPQIPQKPTIQNIGGNNYIPVVPKGIIFGQALDPTTNPHINHAGDTGVFIQGHNVTLSPFYMGETEITYKLYKEVYEWGKANGYTFTVAEDCSFNMATYQNDCTPNPDKEPFAKGGNSGSYDETIHSELEPVTQISWRDAVIWANAYTEMTQGSDAECIYRKAHNDDRVLKSAIERDQLGFVVDFTFPQLDKKGFRLPTEAEWEYAARYQGSDNTNAVQYGDTWLTKLWSLSGMTDKIAYEEMSQDERENTDLIAQLATEANRVAVFNEEYNGTSWVAKAEPKTLEVKKKAPNALGLYDMSGNVAEMCFDAYSFEHLVGTIKDPQGPLPGSGYAVGQRVKRGGHFLSKAADSMVGSRFGITPKYRGDYEGFRVVFRKDTSGTVKPPVVPNTPDANSLQVQITQPNKPNFDADGFFTFKGHSINPMRNNARKNHDYILVEISKVDDTEHKTKARYFVRNNFEEKIWLPFGKGQYNVEVFTLDSVVADLYGDGDIRSFRKEKIKKDDHDSDDHGHDHGHEHDHGHGSDDDDKDIKPPLYSFEVNNIRNEDGRFAYASQYVQSDDPIIRKKALEITKNKNSTAEKVHAIHEFVLDTLQYDEASLRPAERKKQDALSVLNSGWAVCEGYTFLTAALARSIGIKTKTIAGFAGNPGQYKGAHAWVEVLVDGKWKIVDPTMNDDYNLREIQDILLDTLPDTHERHPHNPERPDV